MAMATFGQKRKAPTIEPDKQCNPLLVSRGVLVLPPKIGALSESPESPFATKKDGSNKRRRVEAANIPAMDGTSDASSASGDIDDSLFEDLFGKPTTPAPRPPSTSLVVRTRPMLSKRATPSVPAAEIEAPDAHAKGMQDDEPPSAEDDSLFKDLVAALSQEDLPPLPLPTFCAPVTSNRLALPKRATLSVPTEGLATAPNVVSGDAAGVAPALFDDDDDGLFDALLSALSETETQPSDPVSPVPMSHSDSGVDMRSPAPRVRVPEPESDIEEIPSPQSIQRQSQAHNRRVRVPEPDSDVEEIPPPPPRPAQRQRKPRSKKTQPAPTGAGPVLDITRIPSLEHAKRQKKAHAKKDKAVERPRYDKEYLATLPKPPPAELVDHEERHIANDASQQLIDKQKTHYQGLNELEAARREKKRLKMAAYRATLAEKRGVAGLPKPLKEREEA